MRPALLTTAALMVGLAATAAAAQTAPAIATRDFLAAASQSDQFEITEGVVVAAQSRDPQVLAFAREMTQDHGRTSANLMQAAQASGLKPPPPGLGGDHQRMLGELQSLTGAAFDKAYARQQVLAHTQALVVQQRYAEGGPDAAVRQAARTAVPVIQHHLEMAQQLRSSLGGA